MPGSSADQTGYASDRRSSFQLLQGPKSVPARVRCEADPEKHVGQDHVLAPDRAFSRDGPPGIFVSQPHSNGQHLLNNPACLRNMPCSSCMTPCYLGCPMMVCDAVHKLPLQTLTEEASPSDSIERSLSTFAVEMATSAMIIGEARHKPERSSPIAGQEWLHHDLWSSLTRCAPVDPSKVLMTKGSTSQLGRGTAPQEGLGLSHAIAERLAQGGVSLSQKSILIKHRRTLSSPLTSPT